MGKKTRPGSIKVSGEDICSKVESFKQLYLKYNLPKELQDAIKTNGYKAPTPVQSQVIPLMFERREILCSAPTGSGKTLAYVLPIVEQLKRPLKTGSFRAIILSPTRELAKQIHREALWISQGYKLRIHHLKDVKEAAVKFSPESLTKFDILVTTPNRLSSLLKTNPPSIVLDKLEWLILDEYDRLFEMGFKEDLEIIYKHAVQSDKLCRAMFSATMDNQLLKWALVQMNNVAIVEVGGKNRATTSVEQQLIYVGTEAGKVLALKEIIMSGIDIPVLIFVEKKDKAKSVVNKFRYDDLNIDYIHSGRTQKERDQIITNFREGKIWFLVCTDLMGRGIDFKGVNVVINYDCPLTAVSYIHRIGRTGRADRKGIAYTFVSDTDKSYLPDIIKVAKRSGCEIPASLVTLAKAKVDKKREGKRDNNNNEQKKDKKKVDWKKDDRSLTNKSKINKSRTILKSKFKGKSNIHKKKVFKQNSK